jgi:hypothetical protein
MGVLLMVSPFLIPCAIACPDIRVVQAAKDVSASQETLIDLFNWIESFFRRLEIYTEVPPTVAMMEMLVEIMVEVLTLLVVTTKEMKLGWMSELTPRRMSTISDSDLFRKVFEEVDQEHKSRG